MPKLKQQPKQSLLQTLEELTNSYPSSELSSALSHLKHDLSWKLLQAALIKEYQDQVVMAMTHSTKTGEQIEASFRSGCAQTLLDMATSVIDKYIGILEKKTTVTEEVRPTE